MTARQLHTLIFPVKNEKRGLVFSTTTLILLAAVPLATYWLGHIFWIELFTRLIILSLAALSLNLLLGFSGLASFGHAVFLGIGAYAVGIPVYHATYGGFELSASYSGVVHFSLAIFVSALFALITGAISLRTKGVHFIMITMAFSQMVYYALVSLEEYGADDGLTVDVRSEFSFIDLEDPVQLFLLCYFSMLFFLFIVHKQNACTGRACLSLSTCCLCYCWYFVWLRWRVDGKSHNFYFAKSDRVDALW